MKLERITTRDEDFGKWYTDVVKQANLMGYGPAKGTMFFKPNGYGIWENIMDLLNKEFKKINIKNVYLPSIFPLNLLEKEKEHIAGFAPEVLQITKAGEETLSEVLMIRPTSEPLFGTYFSQNIDSHNDLPMKLNQWCSVIRWEKRTNPFLRSTEFLWQEGHTAHANEEEAKKLAHDMIELYANFVKKYLSIPVIVGEKTEFERFAGAQNTYTIEAIMHNGYALQSGTSHYLGQGFAKAFDVKFQSIENKKEFAYQTSWGVSTRLIGAIIMTHGDDRGLVLPPLIAPTQVALLELFNKKSLEVSRISKELKQRLSDFRVEVDSSTKGPGYKAAQQEIKGTPIRIEIGPRDLEKNRVTIIRRDTLKKELVKINDVVKYVTKVLNIMGDEMLKKAETSRDKRIIKVSTYEELKSEIKKNNFVLAPFAGSRKEEQKIKDETTATTRCIPLVQIDKKAKCIITKKETNRFVYFAKAY